MTCGAVATLFEEHVEHGLIQPTFITDFPKPISPLSKASPANPAVAERFELYVGAMELANGFSELNDPVEQYDRFRDQVLQRERGDEEAMVMDEDYIRALSYGMPPAAGIGVGIDRLIMLLADVPQRYVASGQSLGPKEPGFVERCCVAPPRLDGRSTGSRRKPPGNYQSVRHF